jgi:hypothetical protein
MVHRCRRDPRIDVVDRYIIIIEGRNFEDVDEVELIGPPEPGEPIETTLGQCIVVGLESPPANGAYAGKIICRLP